MLLNIDIKRVALSKKEILRDISFSPRENSFTAVIGKNGSGKSTLVSAIAGLIPYEGSISLDGTEIGKIKRRDLSRLVSFIPQNTPRPHIKVRDLASYGRAPYRMSGHSRGADDEATVNEALARAELSEISECFLDRISGGEERRAYFAMMLAQNTDIALLDEATAFMDADFERRFVIMQKELSKGKTVISVMHNLSLAAAYADNILLLDAGRAIFYGTPSELLRGELIEETFSVKRYTAEGAVFFA